MHRPRAVAEKNVVTVEKIFGDLQQGSDVRGIAMEGEMLPRESKSENFEWAGIADEAVTLTPVRLYFIAAGFVRWLCGRTNKSAESLKISIGRDPRISGTSRSRE